MNQAYRFSAPTLSPINKIIIIVSVAVFLLASILELTHTGSLLGWLGLSARGVLSGKVFQFLTYPLMEKNFFGLLFNCLLMWFIGSDLEVKWGKKLYLQFILATTLSAGLIYFLISVLFFKDAAMFSFPLLGLNATTYGLIGSYAMIYAEREFLFMFIFPLKAKYFCMLLIGVLLYQAIFSAYALSAWGHLAGMAFGLSFLKLKSIRFKQSEQKRKNHLKLVKADEDKPKYWH
jgi:membrane associated rhomboid family serine protease